MPGRNHSRQFKLDCAREVATGQKRPAQLCREHNLAESVLLRWRKEYEARGEEVFTDKQAFSREEALELRMAERERSQSYAVMVPKTNAVPLDGRKKKIEQLVEQLLEDAYSEVSPAEDTGERRPWQWACIELSGDEDNGMSRWLLVRRGYEDPQDIAYWLAYEEPQTSTSELVRVCDARWTIEECFSQAKGEVGLDQYEVRRWDAWHRYATLCLLAHAFLAVTRLAAHTEEEGRKKGISTPV